MPIAPDRDAALLVSDGGSISTTALIFSGWVAMSEGDEMRTKFGLAEGKEVPIERDDICYLQLVQEEESSEYSLKIHRSGEI